MLKEQIKNTIPALLIAVISMGYVSAADAAKPDSPGKPGGGSGGGGGADCTISTSPSPAVITEGGSIDFTGSVSGKQPSTYAWTFDDGSPSSSSQKTVTITYTTAGSYTAELNGTNGKGKSCSTTTTVTVNTAGGGGGGGGGSSDTSFNSTSSNGAVTSPVSVEDLINPGSHTLLVANDLGMHCADMDYQIFTILPPFNVKHAQVIQRGTNGGSPELLDDTDVEVIYSAVSAPAGKDPALANSTASDRGEATVYKGNFWDTVSGDANALWFEVYSPLYFGLLQPTDLVHDKGLPVPDSMKLAGNGGANCLESADPRAECQLVQADMPGISNPYLANEPHMFARFDHSFNFFNGLLGGLGLGAVIPETNWFSEEGIPIMPVDDEGRNNSYPLLRVQARDKATGEILATTDSVVPVASEADCQQCHARTMDCEVVNNTYGYSMQCDEEALDRSHPEIPEYQMPVVAELGDPDIPGETMEQQLLNAAKINILRLHDAKNGHLYVSQSDDGNGGLTWASTPCTDGTQDSCLDKQRRVVCASCHYSPALDLAQLGPTDSLHTQQTRHISMSRAMHGHHGDLMDKQGTTALFPNMPAPDDPMRLEPVAEHTANYPLAPTDTNMTVEDYVLQQSCYSCHPGKRTKCLRGAMASAGVVCQDCHGDMLAVGDDFTHDFPNNPGNMDTSKRIPWAVEPACQSCHVGDAINQPSDQNGFIYASDNIRLLRAFRTQDADAATPIKSPDSAFAENQVVNDQGKTVDALYRLSKGHGGLMCEGCHGSTHAIWPNANDDANDNIAAKQIQGHVGTITECTSCHDSSFNIDDFKGNLDSNGRMKGPHGMHPVGDPMWNEKHKEVFNDGGSAADLCETCHGSDGLGTVLSSTATDRVFECKSNGTLCSNDQKTVTFPKGTPVGCVECHNNKIGRGGS
jgi:hypothetical protein